jgi:hypothetical protein
MWTENTQFNLYCRKKLGRRGRYNARLKLKKGRSKKQKKFPKLKDFSRSLLRILIGNILFNRFIN